MCDKVIDGLLAVTPTARSYRTFSCDKTASYRSFSRDTRLFTQRWYINCSIAIYNMSVNEIPKTNNRQIEETDNELCQYCTRYKTLDSAREHLRNKALIENLTFVSG